MIKKLNFDKILFIYSILFIVGIPLVKLVSYYFYLNEILDSIFIINQVYVLWAMIPFLFITYVLGTFILVNKFYGINPQCRCTATCEVVSIAGRRT